MTMIMAPVSNELMELLFEVAEEEGDVETVVAAVEVEELTWLDEELELEVELVLEDEFEVVPVERFELVEEAEAIVDCVVWLVELVVVWVDVLVVVWVDVELKD